MICTANWELMSELLPPSGMTVLFYQEGDLYPIVGHRGRGIIGDGPKRENYYIIEEGGCEAGEHRKYPFAQNYKPTHWCELPQTPLPGPVDGR